MKNTAFFLVLFLFAGSTFAQDAEVSGYTAEVMVIIDQTAERVIGLAEAIPGETYDWRPAEGVRSVQEAFAHIAEANFGIPRMIGAAAPEGFEFGSLEKKTMTKEEVIQMLKESFDHLRAAVRQVDPQNLEAETPWFGGSNNTVRGVLLFIPKHLGEHQGQLIAYARTNGVTPPWSQ